MIDWKSTKYEPPKAWEEQERERNIDSAQESLKHRGGGSLRMQFAGLVVSAIALGVAIIGLLYYLLR